MKKKEIMKEERNKGDKKESQKWKKRGIKATRMKEI